MRTSKDFTTEVSNINGDVEVAIAKILRKSKIKEVDGISIHFGPDERGVNCVSYGGTKILFINVIDNIKLLEKLEVMAENMF